MHRQDIGRGWAFAWAVGAIAIVAAIAGFGVSASAAEVWREGSVLTITESVEVLDSLTIEPGVTAYFSPTASINVQAGATLTIAGTSDAPVRLMPLNPPSSWFGVWFLPGSEGTVRYMELTGADSVSLSIEGSSPLIEFCRIGDTVGSDGSPLRAGIRVGGVGAAPIIRGCVIESLRGHSRAQANDGTNGSDGPNGANGTAFSGKDGKVGTSGTNGTNGSNGVSGGAALGIWVADGATATIESNVIRWIEGGAGGAGGPGGVGGAGGDGGDGFDSSLTPGLGGQGGDGGQGGKGGNGGSGGNALGIFVEEQVGGELVIAGNAIYAIGGGRGGASGLGGAGGQGGDGGEGGSCGVCFDPGDGADGGAGGAGGAAGTAGFGGLTRAIGVQLPASPSSALVVNNTVALILAPVSAAGGTGGAGGVGGLGGAAGDGFGSNDGLDGSNGASGTPGASTGVGGVPVPLGVSATGRGLTVITRNHASHLDPAGVATGGSAAFRAEINATMSVSHSVFAGQSVVAVGAVTIGPSSVDADPEFVAPPLAFPVPSDCCTWVVGQDGCSNAACETLVCGHDPTCCGSAWDSGCADLAWSLCPNLCQPFASTDLTLAGTSPAIDLGLNAAVPAFLTNDLAFEPRITDGDGDGAAVVDAGAYESPAIECGVDLTCDGSVNGADLAVLLGAWGPCPAPCVADLDGSGAVDGADLAVLLGSWR